MSNDVPINHIARLEDLAVLFQRLGYRRVWEPALSLAGAERGAVVARLGSFRIVGLEVRSEPMGAAVRVAARQRSRVERSLVVAIQVGGGEAAFAAWRARGNPARQSLGLDPIGPREHSLLERLRPRPDDTPLALHFRLAGVLEAEGLSHRFFAAFRKILNRFAQSCSASGSSDETRMLALTCLTRVLFLFFVQVKGWLNGEAEFLTTRLDRALVTRRCFHRTVLDPLCFGVLNQPHGTERSTAFGSMPFLNGGLFERTALESKHGAPTWPNVLWRQAFDQLFNRFQFSVHESGAAGVIEPDMLGRVFEGLMQPERRRAVGAFYTPHRLVLRVLDEALGSVLAGRSGTSPQAIERLLAGKRPVQSDRPRLLEAVHHLTLLDPAVGSGAFLLGALSRLTLLWQTLLGPHAPSPHRLRHHILRNCLFGVDLDPAAVRLAELRLWLAVIADDQARTAAEIAPLPNLDGVVRQGDSLVDPVTLAAQVSGGRHLLHDARPEIAKVGTHRRSLFSAVGAEKRAVVGQLRVAERRVAYRVLDAAIAQLEKEMSRIMADGRSPTLFGQPTGLDTRARARLKACRAHWHAARTTRRRLRDTDQVPFFSYETHCPDVLADGGFDLVIGNPPWVRGERLPPPLRAALVGRYRAYRPTGRGYAHFPDLAQAFVERGLELAAPGGVVAMLLPSKLATAGYAAPLRALLARQVSLERVLRLDARESAQFRAAVYPMLVVLRKTPPSSGQPASHASGPWVLAGGAERALARELSDAAERISDTWPPRLGTKTGANAVFLGHVEGNDFVSLSGKRVEVQRGQWRPAIRGRDVRPFTVRSPAAILWTHDNQGRPLVRLPSNLQAYFAEFEPQLSRRHDVRRLPFWSLFRTAASPPAPRTVWPDIARTLGAAALPAGNRGVPINTCYAIVHRDDFEAFALCTLLNSTPLRCLAALNADEARGHFRRFNARVVGNLPLPPRPGRWADLAAFGERGHRERYDQRALDDIACQAFDLTGRARARVERLAGALG